MLGNGVGGLIEGLIDAFLHGVSFIVIGYTRLESMTCEEEFLAMGLCRARGKGAFDVHLVSVVLNVFHLNRFPPVGL